MAALYPLRPGRGAAIPARSCGSARVRRGLDRDTVLGPNHQPLVGAFLDPGIGSPWSVPEETVRIEDAYPDFMPWVLDRLGDPPIGAFDAWFSNPVSTLVVDRTGDVAGTAPLEQPTCVDGVENGAEAAPDCGGASCASCASCFLGDRGPPRRGPAGSCPLAPP